MEYTITTTDKRVWHLVPSLPTPGVPGVLRALIARMLARSQP